MVARAYIGETLSEGQVYPIQKLRLYFVPNLRLYKCLSQLISRLEIDLNNSLTCFSFSAKRFGLVREFFFVRKSF